MKNINLSEQKIGERLKKVREEKNLTIENVSNELKIRRKYIEAIEKSDYSQFNACVYAKGFVKNYARFLGLDVEKYVKLFRREVYGEFEKKTEIKTGLNFHSFNLNFILNQKKASLILVALCFVFALIWFLFRFFSVSQKPVLILQKPVPANSQEISNLQFDTTSSTVTLSGEIEHGNLLLLNNERIETLGFREFEISDLYLEQGENTFVITTQNQFGLETQIELVVIRSEKQENS